MISRLWEEFSSALAILDSRPGHLGSTTSFYSARDVSRILSRRDRQMVPSSFHFAFSCEQFANARSNRLSMVSECTSI